MHLSLVCTDAARISVSFESINTPFTFPCFYASCAALIPIALYNGKRGRKCKWFFYIAYPAHIALLDLISLLLN